jgi:hypothetical protein
MADQGTAGLPVSSILISFFQKLEQIDFITRTIISHARIRALLTFRGNPERRVLLDYSQSPGRVVVDGEAREGQITVSVPDQIMHEVLLGRLPPGVAVGRREMLLRGSANDLAKFTPLFEFAPVLYQEHLAQIGWKSHARPTDRTLCTEAAMDDTLFKGDPIPLVKLSTFEKAVFSILNGFSYAMGYTVGILRYRLFPKLNLFSVLASMSKGLAAAAPREAEAAGTRNSAEAA